MDERSAQNAAAVKEWAEDNWSKWFFRTFREKDPRPLRFSREAPTTEIETLFRSSSEEVRYRMQRGLVDALRMWDEEFHGRAVLRELAWTAGKIRAVYAVPALIKILLDNRERMQWDSVFFDTADILLGVVTGFAVDEPDKRIEAAFDGLFHDAAVAPHFSATLALGISICNPARFVEAFNRFVDLQAKADDYLVATDIIAQFAEHLTVKWIRDKIDLLSDEANDYAFKAGVSAELWKAHEVSGVGPVTTKHPNLQIVPFADTAAAYDKADRRYRTSVSIYKGERGEHVFDTSFAKMRQMKRPPERAFA